MIDPASRIARPPVAGELWRVETDDGLLLDGFFRRGLDVESLASEQSIDAVLLVHGTGSHFHAPGVLERFADRCVNDGLDVLRIDTRGHDGMSTIPARGGSVTGGATFETISECDLDLRAWSDALAERGARRIALVGHSMGAVKSIHFAAHDRHPNLRRLIAISPPRFAHRKLFEHPQGESFRSDYAAAVRLASEGRPEDLMNVTQPLPLVITAAGFLAKYGPHDDYDHIRWFPSLTVPTLIVLGTGSVATSLAFAGLPDEIRRIAAANSSVTLELVEGANTGYSGHLDVPYEIAAEWLRASRT